MIQGETALILAARNGHAGCVELLLDRGDDIEAKDNRVSACVSRVAIVRLYQRV